MISELTCWLDRELFGGLYFAWLILQVAILSMFIAFAVRLDGLAAKQGPPRYLNGSLFVIVYLLLLCLWLPNFPRGELNIDESQWIAQANNLAAHPQLWIDYFLPVALLRILTIIPLIPANILAGGNIEYDSARLIAIAMWSGIVVGLFAATRRVYGFRPALWAAAVLAVCVGMFSTFDFVAYNSELPVLLLCIASYAMLMRVATMQGVVWSAAAAGCLLAAIPFAKHQGLPLGAMLGAGAIVVCAARGGWKYVASLFGGVAVWFLLVLALLLASDNVAETAGFMATFRDYAVVRTHWAWSGPLGQVASLAVIARRSSELHFLLLTAAGAVPALLLLWRNGHWRPNRLQLCVAIWATALFAVASFAVGYPGQRFLHYGLLLLLPSAMLWGALLQAWFQTAPHRGWFRLLPWALLALFLLSYGRGHEGVRNLPRFCAAREENVLTGLIKKLALPGDRLMVWGWQNSYFVETGLLQGSRWMYPVFAIGSYSSAADNVRRYVEDIDFLQPRFILEWVGDDAFYFDGPRAVRMEDIPEIGAKISEHYELVALKGNQRLFVRRGTTDAYGE